MSRKIKEIKQLTDTGYVGIPIGCDAENVDFADGNTLEEFVSSIDTHIGNETIHITSSERSAWNGKLDADGDSQNNTITFTSGDNADPAAWTDVATLASGEKHSSIFSKVSTMFKNIRYLYQMLGTTDISSLGNGTVTGALSQLNTDLLGKVPASTESKYNFTNAGYGTINIDETYNYNYVTSVNGNGIGTLPLANQFYNIVNFYSVHYATQLAFSCEMSADVNRKVKVWARERFVLYGTNFYTWSDWVALI